MGCLEILKVIHTALTDRDVVRNLEGLQWTPSRLLTTSQAVKAARFTYFNYYTTHKGPQVSKCPTLISTLDHYVEIVFCSLGVKVGKSQ